MMMDFNTPTSNSLTSYHYLFYTYSS